MIYQELSPDGKTREIKAMRMGGLPRVLWRDRDERWWSPTNRDAKLLVSPDGKSVAFVSDRTGWIHVYVMPLDATSESQAKALTSGNFGTGLGSWSPDSRRIAYHHSAPGNQMERFVDVVDVATGRNEPVVAVRGVNLDPLFAPDGRSLVYQRSDVENSLDLYAVPARAGDTPVRLSDSMPAGLNKSDLVAPTAVSFPSRLDKAPVPSTLMLPKNLDTSTRHPAIVWIHGSGSDRHAAQAGQAVRDGGLSRRDPLLPARAHSSRRVATRRGVLRHALEARHAAVEPVVTRLRHASIGDGRDEAASLPLDEQRQELHAASPGTAPVLAGRLQGFHDGHGTAEVALDSHARANLERHGRDKAHAVQGHVLNRAVPGCLARGRQTERHRQMARHAFDGPSRPTVVQMVLCRAQRAAARRAHGIGPHGVGGANGGATERARRHGDGRRRGRSGGSWGWRG